MIRLLIVDDSALMRRFLARIFETKPDFDVATARDGREAIAMLDSYKPDVITLDIEMPGMDGLACLDRIMIEHPCPVVMVSSLTAHGAEETLQALDMGAVDFIAKPSGTVSLHADELAPMIEERVRSAAAARISRTSRLVERMRFQSGAAPERKAPRRSAVASKTTLRDHDGGTIVLIGASTGGPAALDQFLSSLPAPFQWPILVAQHMPESFTGSFARRLDGLCPLAVVEVTRPMPVEPGTVYIGKGEADLILSRRNGDLVTLPAPCAQEYRWHPSVDRLVRSAMQHHPAAGLVAILMTGMGNDGATAMTELREAGGHTIAEAEETAIVWGMPGDLVRRGGASEVVPLPKIAERLVQLSPWR